MVYNAFALTRKAPKCMGGGRLRRTGDHLGCRTPKDEATDSVKGTVY